jgi:hypothetical protein
MASWWRHPESGFPLDSLRNSPFSDNNKVDDSKAVDHINNLVLKVLEDIKEAMSKSYYIGRNGLHVTLVESQFFSQLDQVLSSKHKMCELSFRDDKENIVKVSVSLNHMLWLLAFVVNYSQRIYDKKFEGVPRRTVTLDTPRTESGKLLYHFTWGRTTYGDIISDGDGDGLQVLLVHLNKTQGVPLPPLHRQDEADASAGERETNNIIYSD